MDCSSSLLPYVRQPEFNELGDLKALRPLSSGRLMLDSVNLHYFKVVQVIYFNLFDLPYGAFCDTHKLIGGGDNPGLLLTDENRR